MLELLAAAAVSNGGCFSSTKGTQLCVLPISDRVFAAAFTIDGSNQPSVLVLHCDQYWRGKGPVTHEVMTAVVTSICQVPDENHSHSA